MNIDKICICVYPETNCQEANLCVSVLKVILKDRPSYTFFPQNGIPPKTIFIGQREMEGLISEANFLDRYPEII